MQTMSDKELDEVFRVNFESYSVEPSPEVWNQIAGQIPSRRRNNVVWYRLAAACFLGAFLYSLPFFRQKEVIKLQGSVVRNEMEQMDTSGSNLMSETTPLNKEEAPKVQIARIPQVRQAVSKVNLEEPVTQEEKIQSPPSKTIQSAENLIPVKSIAGLDGLSEVENEVPVLAMANFTESSELLASEEGGRKKIKTVADLVNFVVARVDKRENKIIEFTKEDEGDVVSGLNLGVVQFKTNK